MTIYFKTKGYDDYHKVDVELHKSNKEYNNLLVTKIESVSKRQYYSQPNDIRFIDNGGVFFTDKQNGCKYIHEVGNSEIINKVTELINEQKHEKSKSPLSRNQLKQNAQKIAHKEPEHNVNNKAHDKGQAL